MQIGVLPTIGKTLNDMVKHNTQKEGDHVGLPIIGKGMKRKTTYIFTKLEKSKQNLADFQDSDFEVPIYNLWTFATLFATLFATKTFETIVNTVYYAES